jgi:hypothetical protein
MKTLNDVTSLHFDGANAMDELSELMQELLQRLSDALDRAKAGEATESDWKLIRTQLGM